MLRLSGKLKYMFLGGFLTFVVLMYGNMNNDTEAQFGSETIDALTVGELTVLEDITVIGDDGNDRVVISWDGNGGRIACLGSSGVRTAGLQIGMLGGIAGVLSGKSIAGASLTIGTEGGGVTIFPVNGQGGAALSIVDGSGAVFTRDRFGNMAAHD